MAGTFRPGWPAWIRASLIARQREVRREIKIAQERGERRGKLERIAIGLSHRELEAVKRGKRLQLDEPGLNLSLRVPHEAEIDLEEGRQRLRTGAGVPRWHRTTSGRHGRVAVEDLADQIEACIGELRHQRSREEAWGLAERERQRRASTQFQPPDQIAVRTF